MAVFFYSLFDYEEHTIHYFNDFMAMAMSCVHAYVFWGLNPSPLTCYEITPSWGYILCVVGCSMISIWSSWLLVLINWFLCLFVLFISEDRLRSLYLHLLVCLMHLLWSSSVGCTTYMAHCVRLANWASYWSVLSFFIFNSFLCSGICLISVKLLHTSIDFFLKKMCVIYLFLSFYPLHHYTWNKVAISYN